MFHSWRVLIACIATLCLSTTAFSQVVTIQSSGYVAGPPPKADPAGTWSKPLDGAEYKVTYDYGTVAAGVFTPDATIGLGGTVFLPVGSSSGTWGPIGQDTLVNPLPNGTHIRAIMYKKQGNKWIPTTAVAYYSIP